MSTFSCGHVRGLTECLLLNLNVSSGGGLMSDLAASNA
jgi:hypothetical protein